MSNTTVTSTLSDAVFSDGETLSGTWTDVYNSGGTLIGLSNVDVVLDMDVNGTIEAITYTSGTVNFGGSVASENYEIHLTATGTDTISSTSTTTSSSVKNSTTTAVTTVVSETATISNLFLDWTNGQIEPANLATGTVHPTTNYNEYTTDQGSVSTVTTKTTVTTRNGKSSTTGSTPTTATTSGVLGSLVSGGVITNEITCFAAGTMIRTPAGEQPVESLKAGDMVLTAGGKALPVRWLGYTTVSGQFADPLRAAPVRIKAGALGEALPAQDLRVSPAHALFLDGRLVEAGALVNGASILREAMEERFIYYHIELETHELLVSNGVASESFVDNASRMNFDNWAEHEAPETAAPIAEMALPRVKSARQLSRALRAALGTRAAQFAQTQAA